MSGINKVIAMVGKIILVASLVIAALFFVMSLSSADGDGFSIAIGVIVSVGILLLGLILSSVFTAIAKED